jgi:DNA-binding transcriptional regulator YhcF (GntR family)
MYRGFVKVYRKILESPIWKTSNSNLAKLAVHCLLRANHKETKVMRGRKTETLKPGQFLTSLDSLKYETKLSIQTIRTCLLNLEKFDFLTIDSTKAGTIISIVNWDSYQPDQTSANKQDNNSLTNDQQTSNNKQEYKNDNNDKKERKEYTQAFESFWEYFPFTTRVKGPKPRAFSLFQFHNKQGNMDQIRIATKNMKDAVEAGQLEQEFMVASFLAKKPGIQNHWTAWLEPMEKRAGIIGIDVDPDYVPEIVKKLEEKK